MDAPTALRRPFVLKSPQIDAPTAFSPNFDGVNDVFLIKTRGISKETMIFDRWGNLVFQSSDMEMTYPGMDFT